MVSNDSADIFIKDIKFKDWDIMPALLINNDWEYSLRFRWKRNKA